MSRAYGNLAELVLATLRESGPMTRRHLERHLCMAPRRLGDVVARLARPYKGGLQRAHILGWQRTDPLEPRDYPRPIYAAGHGANAPAPKPLGQTQWNARYRAKQQAKKAAPPATMPAASLPHHTHA